ncbi:hypothetical protein HN814_01715, partial [Candidatus Woesearchaeota archaeon]|nr:hypothetical protein [Candidatus Woesearchaeota archaeon]
MKQENECLTCGKCCNYVTVALDEPSDYDDWNQLFWYLHHEKVFVYIDHDGDWFVEFKTKCEQTMSDGRCAVYSERPEVCRDHEADDCENNNCESPYLELFANVDELKEYMQKKEIDLEMTKD